MQLVKEPLQGHASIVSPRQFITGPVMYYWADCITAPFMSRMRGAARMALCCYILVVRSRRQVWRLSWPSGHYTAALLVAVIQPLVFIIHSPALLGVLE